MVLGVYGLAKINGSMEEVVDRHAAGRARPRERLQQLAGVISDPCRAKPERRVPGKNVNGNCIPSMPP